MSRGLSQAEIFPCSESKGGELFLRVNPNSDCLVLEIPLEVVFLLLEAREAPGKEYPKRVVRAESLGGTIALLKRAL